MPGFMPGIHLLTGIHLLKMDCRDKPGNDEVFAVAFRTFQTASDTHNEISGSDRMFCFWKGRRYSAACPTGARPGTGAWVIALMRSRTLKMRVSRFSMLGLAFMPATIGPLR